MKQKMQIMRKDAKPNEAKMFVCLFRKLKQKSCKTACIFHLKASDKAGEYGGAHTWA
jgi:hypothetical protein